MTRPSDIDPTKKEAYLSMAEFEAIFKQSKSAFYAQPKWKQVNQRKAAGLF